MKKEIILCDICGKQIKEETTDKSFLFYIDVYKWNDLDPKTILNIEDCCVSCCSKITKQIKGIKDFVLNLKVEFGIVKLKEVNESILDKTEIATNASLTKTPKISTLTEEEVISDEVAKITKQPSAKEELNELTQKINAHVENKMYDAAIALCENFISTATTVRNEKAAKNILKELQRQKLLEPHELTESEKWLQTVVSDFMIQKKFELAINECQIFIRQNAEKNSKKFAEDLLLKVRSAKTKFEFNQEEGEIETLPQKETIADLLSEVEDDEPKAEDNAAEAAETSPFAKDGEEE